MNKIIIDFDSTFVKIESLEELAKICLKNHPKKNSTFKKIQQITKDGMDGNIPFETSLKQRLELFKINKKNIEELINVLNKNITTSIEKNKSFFRQHKNNIYIISGGFKEYILPICEKFSIDTNHILANNFIFDTNQEVVGFDRDNPLSQKTGKATQVRQLNLLGKIYVIGDGYTDYEIKKYQQADIFLSFTENVRRQKIVNLSDEEIKNFDEFINIFNKK